MSDAKDKQVNEIDDSQESKEPKTEAIEYKVTCAVARQIGIGVTVTVFCIIFGIVLAQLIGALVRCIIKESENYFSDFLGGALGLSVGFLLDKICLEKINYIFKCKNFLTAVTHELDNIQYKDDKGKSRKFVAIPKVEELNSGKKKVTFVEEEVTLDEKYNFKVKDEKICEAKQTYYRLIGRKELILDDIVTSAETMSLIANLPVGTKNKLETVKFKNEFIDYLGGVHRLIGEYNKIFAQQKECIKNNQSNKVNNILCLEGLKKMQELYNHIKKFGVVADKKSTTWRLEV